MLTRSLDSIGAYVLRFARAARSGLIPPNELLSAEAQQSRERVVSIEAANARGIAEADLRRLLGTDGPGPIEPAARLESAEGRTEDVDRLIAEAISNRPERKALVDRVGAADARTEAAKAGSRPQVGVGGGYDYARPNPRIFPRTDRWETRGTCRSTPSWNLWDGGRTRADRADAAALKRVAEARLSDFDRQVAFEVRQRQLELDSSRAAISATELTACAPLQKRVASSASASPPASSPTPRCSTPRPRSSRPSSIARARWPNARLAEARLLRAVGR